MHIPPLLLLRVFLRTYLINAAYNMQGLQNIGFIYALEPGLKAIYSDREKLREAEERYVHHHNCHPFWSPFLTGIFLRTEAEISAGRMSPGVFVSLKNTMMNSLSALGDSVFNGSLLATWVLFCIVLVIAGYPGIALAICITLFVALQIFKVCTFAAGLRFGLTALNWLKRWDLINWGSKFKEINALLLLFIFAQCVPYAQTPMKWISIVFCIIFCAWLTTRCRISRELLAVLGATGLLLST